MRTSFKLGLSLIFLSHALTGHAQTPQKQLRFDFSGFVGYRSAASFTGPEPEATPTDVTTPLITPKVVVDPSPSYGVSFGARINELDLIEVRWARMNTTMRLEQNFLTTFQQNVIVDQYHGDFTHEYIVEDWPFNVRPYIMASIGATHYSGSATRNFTRFSFGIGGGFKLFVNRNVGFRIQGEWLPIFIDPEVAIACGAGCVMRIRTQAASQAEFAVGPIIRF